MYEYIKGNMAYRALEYVVIENQGIGYKIMTSECTAKQCVVGTEVTLYTELVVREDYMGLCGFASKEELKVYQLLTSISGIGMKAALSVLSKIEYTDLTRAIMMGDVKSLQKAPGIGAKTAQRIVLELKGQAEQEFGKYTVAFRNGGRRSKINGAGTEFERCHGSHGTARISYDRCRENFRCDGQSKGNRRGSH